MRNLGSVHETVALLCCSVSGCGGFRFERGVDSEEKLFRIAWTISDDIRVVDVPGTFAYG